MRSVIIHISSIVSDQRCFLHEWGGGEGKKKKSDFVSSCGGGETGLLQADRGRCCIGDREGTWNCGEGTTLRFEWL